MKVMKGVARSAEEGVVIAVVVVVDDVFAGDAFCTLDTIRRRLLCTSDSTRDDASGTGCSAYRCAFVRGTETRAHLSAYTQTRIIPDAASFRIIFYPSAE